MTTHYSEKSGAILVNKPSGMSSADVVNKIKRKFKPKKIGHAGTLDPFATGLLVVLFGKATKLQDLFMSGTKEYRGTFLLGTATTSDDFTGEILKTELIDSSTWDGITVQLSEMEHRFTGVISQVPPAVSAIKVDGERSYKLARKGVAVELKARAVTIHSIKLADAGQPLISYLIRCSKGTYIRSLARDIALELGTVGCVQSLERTASEPFAISGAIELDQLLDSESLDPYFLDFDLLTTSFVRFVATHDEVAQMKLGRQEMLTRFKSEVGDFALVVDEKGLSVAVLDRVVPNLSASGWKIRFMV